MVEKVYAMRIVRWQGGRKGLQSQNPLVKIGNTTEDIDAYKGILEARFKAELELLDWVEISKDGEKLLHRVFHPHRIRIRQRRGLGGRYHREFFDLTEDQVNAAFDLIRLLVRINKIVSPYVGRGDEEAKDRDDEGEEDDSNCSARPIRSPSEKTDAPARKRSDIPVDAVLTFIEDPRITCTVIRKTLYARGRRVQDLKVKYDRRIDWSLSDLTKHIKKGSPNTQYDGWLYWEYNGVLLRDLKKG